MEDRRVLPVRHVFLWGHVQSLRYVERPHVIRLYGVETVKDAPDVLEKLETKIAEGWRVGDRGLAPLLLVVRLHHRLLAVRQDILLALIADPLDMNAYARLRTHGAAIRRIGRDPSATIELRALAVKLGNRLKKVAARMMSGELPAAWFESRRRSLFQHTRKVFKEHYIPLL